MIKKFPRIVFLEICLSILKMYNQNGKYLTFESLLDTFKVAVSAIASSDLSMISTFRFTAVICLSTLYTSKNWCG